MQDHSVKEFRRAQEFQHNIARHVTPEWFERTTVSAFAQLDAGAVSHAETVGTFTVIIAGLLQKLRETDPSYGLDAEPVDETEGAPHEGN